MSGREGPKVTVKRSCFDCKHCRSESYQCQSDSGSVVSCAHPALDMSQRIGDTTWDTPKWCPVAEPEHPYTVALRRLVEARKAVAVDPGGYMPDDNERKAGKLAALHKAFADAEATLADSATVGSALLGGAR